MISAPEVSNSVRCAQAPSPAERSTSHPSVIMHILLMILFFGMVPVPRSTQTTEHVNMLVNMTKPPMSIVHPISSPASAAAESSASGSAGAASGAAAVALLFEAVPLTEGLAEVPFAAGVAFTAATTWRRRSQVSTSWVTWKPSSSITRTESRSCGRRC